MSSILTRKDDERDLSILRRACAGEHYGEISRSVNRGSSFANVVVSRIRAADLAESGEAGPQVLALYPALRRGVR